MGANFKDLLNVSPNRQYFKNEDRRTIYHCPPNESRRIPNETLCLDRDVVGVAAGSELPADYRQKLIPVEQPLVLEYSFGPGPRNKAELHVVNYPNGASDLFFFHMHINEANSREAGLEAVRKNGGTFMYLHHFSGGRNMRVQIGGTTYEFDPNRIFTAAGLADRTQPKPTPQDLAELQLFVDWVT